jgi:hypothetical protein
MKAQFGAAAFALAAAGCDPGGGSAPSQGSTTPAYERAEVRPLEPGRVPVRVGENGPSFPACYGMARFRERVVTEPVPVRAAPSDQAEEIARIAPGGRFFLCSRSHDQRWLAIVWHAAEGASRSCGVSRPSSARRDYEGPCESGWIPSALVHLESRIVHPEEGAGNSTD